MVGGVKVLFIALLAFSLCLSAVGADKKLLAGEPIDTPRSDLRVSLGRIAQTKSGYLTVLGPKERAVPLQVNTPMQSCSSAIEARQRKLHYWTLALSCGRSA